MDNSTAQGFLHDKCEYHVRDDHVHQREDIAVSRLSVAAIKDGTRCILDNVEHVLIFFAAPDDVEFRFPLGRYGALHLGLPAKKLNHAYHAQRYKTMSMVNHRHLMDALTFGDGPNSVIRLRRSSDQNR